jgi:hypothetical protein
MIGAAVLDFFLCYTKNVYDLPSYANILLGDHTTGRLDSITAQTMAIGVLLFPCLVASQIHSTADIVSLLYSRFVMVAPATVQPSDSQQQLISKEQPVVNLTSIDASEGDSISWVRALSFSTSFN